MHRTADLVVRGARVYTGDPNRPWVDAVAVEAGRIVSLDRAQADELTGPRTYVVDSAGGLVLPGFQDAHVHPAFGGREMLHVDLHDLPSREACLARVAGYAEANPHLDWIVGGGWAMDHFPGGTPRKEDLDAVVADRPVFLFNRELHGAWVNSEALRVAGIDASTSNSSDGYIERDPGSGEPTGTLHEGAAHRFHHQHVPPLARSTWEAAILTGQEHLHSLGITGWQDAWVEPDLQDAYQALADDGRLTARVVGALWWDRDRGVEQVADLVERRAAGATSRFRPTTVKVMLDGVAENRTAAMLGPYHHACGAHAAAEQRQDPDLDHGLLHVAPELLVEAVVALDRADFQVHLHAIGDRAVRNALDACAAARAANGPRGNRHQIAHLQVVHPDDVQRFGELDVIANIQAFWAQYEPQMASLTMPLLGPDRASRQYEFAKLMASGARLAMGSDWPVTTADPLAQIEVATLRTPPGGGDIEAYLPQQALSLSDAVDAFTFGSAYANNDERDAGSIAIGKRADLAVLDRDVLDPGAGPPSQARVTHTVAAGRLVHCPDD